MESNSSNCKILVERGYNVTLIAPGDLLPLSEYPTINQISTGPLIESDATYQELYQKTFNRKQISGLRKLLVKKYLEYFETYQLAIKMIKPDLFFCNIFIINDICLDIAWFRCAIIEPIKSIFEMLSSIEELNKLRSTLGIKPVHNPFERIKDSLFLANTFFGLEVPYPLPPLVQEIGPVMQDKYPLITSKLSSFKSSHSQILFISFNPNTFIRPETNLIILHAIIESIQNKIINSAICNSEKLVGLGVALTLPNYFSTNHVKKIFKILNDENLQKNLKKTKLLVRINSKRKHRAADLIEFVLHASFLIPLDNTVDDDDYDDYRIIEMSGDYEGLLKEWIAPDARMGFFKECI
ncbi:UDP-Glycosyltransferase/glycogen phosphorylase [Gigaspora margarita]|uniref:UDP-Glycosyltransferase/glycogen phosphorylase n=1 Tax=Gigaspora margarita TaxID=4874 RepID=A0A8H3WYN3_GIGMA|nr:UDP-Glycosyltransferase/glycogen phosphorylase [Gigaspora margarita]